MHPHHPNFLVDFVTCLAFWSSRKEYLYMRIWMWICRCKERERERERERENDGRLRVVTNVCQFLLHLVGDLIPLKPNPKGFYTA